MILQEEELLGAVSNEGGNHYESEGIRKAYLRKMQNYQKAWQSDGYLRKP